MNHTLEFGPVSLLIFISIILYLQSSFFLFLYCNSSHHFYKRKEQKFDWLSLIYVKAIYKYEADTFLDIVRVSISNTR